MNTGTAPKICSIAGKRLAAQVAPRLDLDKLPNLLGDAAEPAPKVCSISGKTLPAVPAAPALPALEARSESSAMPPRNSSGPLTPTSSWSERSPA